MVRNPAPSRKHTSFWTVSWKTPLFGSASLFQNRAYFLRVILILHKSEFFGHLILFRNHSIRYLSRAQPFIFSRLPNDRILGLTFNQLFKHFILGFVIIDLIRIIQLQEINLFGERLDLYLRKLLPMRLFPQKIILLPEHQISLCLVFETRIFGLNIFLEINNKLFHFDDSDIQLF